MRRWIKAFAVTTTSLAAVAATVAVAQAAEARNYYALGDSYAAGVGSGNFLDSTCLRTDASYSHFWVTAKGRDKFGSLANRACSGATTATVRSSQLGDLNASTGWVTLSVGGNDAGFTPTITTCAVGSDSACTTAAQTAIRKATTQLPASLSQLYDAIRAKAPNAKVYVLGYPHLLPPATSATNCGFTPAKRAVINHATDVVADVTRNSTTGRSGFTYIDVRAHFAGHEACTSWPWVHGLRLDEPVKSFHANVSGHKQYATLLRQVTG